MQICELVYVHIMIYVGVAEESDPIVIKKQLWLRMWTTVVQYG